MREVLEMAEARELVPSFFATRQKKGAEFAAKWLTTQISKRQRMFGPGFDQRVRGYMRHIVDVELMGEI